MVALQLLEYEIVDKRILQHETEKVNKLFLALDPAFLQAPVIPFLYFSIIAFSSGEALITCPEFSKHVQLFFADGESLLYDVPVDCLRTGRDCKTTLVGEIDQRVRQRAINKIE